MKFIIGIGNPGKEYRKTRHNIGFRVIDALKTSEALKDLPEKISLKKPATYVNRTGEAVAELARRKGFTPSDLLVVCDDVNLKFGKLRLRAGGSSGGHHGLRSVIEALGSEEFPRLRVGVGGESMPRDLAGFVLDRFSSEEERSLDGILERAVWVCRTWAGKGFEAALNFLSRSQSIKQEQYE